MKIVSWNVNGIRAVHKKGLFMPFIEAMKPDILCMQETKAQQHESEVRVPGYFEYWNSAAKKGYSGTAIFSTTEPLSVSSHFPADIVKKFGVVADQFGDPNDEGRLITAEFKDFYIVNVYTPNSKGDLERLPLRHKVWDPAFLAYCKALEKNGSTDSTGSPQASSPHGKPVIFCGDLNVAHTEDDLANAKENEGEHGFTKEEREGVDKMIAAGFIDTFRVFTQGKGHYSWWTPWRGARDRNVGWRIDYFFISKALAAKLKSAQIHASVMGSDHCPISIELDI